MKKGRVFLTVAAVFCSGVLAMGLLPNVEAAEEDQKIRPIVLVAHRAGASFAPENTIAALEQSIQDGASMAEIDVQQLSDGTLVVMHDSNFNRTAGVDLNVWEAKQGDLETMDVGSYFSELYSGERIPTLEEYLLCAGDRIDLMIELKYTGNEYEMEWSVIDLIKRYHMEESCIIGSMNQQILETAKQIDAAIPTVFISHFLTEEQYELDYADSYSIEAKNLTCEMVDRLHAQNKMVYGWTANQFTSMQMILNSGADGIVTDNVYQAQIFLRTLKRTLQLKKVFAYGENNGMIKRNFQ